MRETIETIIKASRCSATVKPADRSCEGCPYRELTPVDDKIPCPPDVEIEGIQFWESCNCDAICNDAADALEDLLDQEGK